MDLIRYSHSASITLGLVVPRFKVFTLSCNPFFHCQVESSPSQLQIKIRELSTFKLAVVDFESVETSGEHQEN
uniref:CSON014393 protein n=1 Tax=Culicoides sonorensis TaxID=179676 RepID=A0A336MEU3_CULSO